MSLTRTALILDLNDVYFSIQHKFGPRKLIISKYVEKLEQMGFNLDYKAAFNTQLPSEAPGFIAALEKIGFETYYDRRDWSIAMAIRAAEFLPNVEAFILGSAAFEAGRLLKYAKSLGKHTHCYACNIPLIFRQYAVCHEIDLGVLGETANPTKFVDVPTNLGSNDSRT